VGDSTRQSISTTIVSILLEEKGFALEPEVLEEVEEVEIEDQFVEEMRKMELNRSDDVEDLEAC